MFIVGLTGGIGSGKSTVSDIFATLGVPVIDTDVIAHQLVAPGQAALSQIVAVFGQQVLTSAGELDRARLREQVFNDPQKREALEAILHPLIRQTALAHIQQLDDAYCILVVPLLVEKQWYTMVHRVLVIDVPVEVQHARVKQRNGISDHQIEAIVKQQATREQRLAYADDVIENVKSIQQITIEVKALHRKYRDFGRQRKDPEKTRTSDE